MNNESAPATDHDLNLLRVGILALAGTEGYRRAFARLLGFIDGVLEEKFMVEYLLEFITPAARLNDVAAALAEHGLRVVVPAGGFVRPLQLHNALLNLLRTTAIKQGYFLTDREAEPPAETK